MKHIIFILFLLINYFSIAQTSWGVVENKNLKGKVKSLKIINYHLISNNNINKKTINDSFTYTYDSNGNITKEVHFSEKRNQLLSETLFTYDLENNLKSEKEKSWIDDYAHLYRYNESSRILERYKSRYGRLITKFDKKSNPIEQIRYFNGKILRTSIFKYDSKGRIIEANSKEIDGSFHRAKETLNYNDEDCSMELKITFSDQKVKIENYKFDLFDSHGNWTERVKYYNDKPQFLTVRIIEMKN